jgi:Spy/CpxP family protein refolding chaperone
MAQQLSLTADQQAQLKSIREAQFKEMKALKESGSSAEELKTKRMELHKKYADQTKAVYTPTQKEQLEKMRTEWKAKAKDGKKGGKDFKKGEGRHGKKGFKKGGDFSKELNFTETQKAEFAKMREESKNSFKALREDKSLTQDQKKEKMKELRKQQNEQMKKILTKEQVEKMESLRKERQSKSSK